GTKETSEYDDAGHLLRRQLWQSDTLVMQVDQTFTAAGQVQAQTRTSFVDGTAIVAAITHYTYDQWGRTTEILHQRADGEVIDDFQYTWENLEPSTSVGAGSVSDGGKLLAYSDS